MKKVYHPTNQCTILFTSDVASTMIFGEVRSTVPSHHPMGCQDHILDINDTSTGSRTMLLHYTMSTLARQHGNGVSY